MKISTVCFPSPCLHGADYPISASRALRPYPPKATDGAEICLPIVSAAATSLTSAKNECCITLPNESTTATAAAALNNGMKRAVNVMRLAFTTGASISASTRASKSAPDALPAEVADIQTNPYNATSVRERPLL